MNMYSVILLVAGTGSRMGLGYNKALYQISGKTIAEHSAQVFLNDERCRQIMLVTSEADANQMKALFSGEAKVEFVIGGDTRQESVCKGLEYVKEEIVLVHDGARPFITQEMITGCYEVAKAGEGALLAVPVKDTIKKMDSENDTLVSHTLDRSELMSAQTPQSAPTHVLRLAHGRAKVERFIGTDEAHLIEKYTDTKVKVVQGGHMNLKFTTPEDIAYFEYVMMQSNLSFKDRADG